MTPPSAVLTGHNVKAAGAGTNTLVFAHGFGCDQAMWRFVAPAFEATHRVVLFDHVGCGQADPARFDHERHARLDGYAQDVLEIIESAGGAPVTYVGHSVSSMIGLLASIRRPELFRDLVLLGPSARYLNEPGYEGGFEEADIRGLLELMETNMVGWADFLAPVVMGPASPGELTQELKGSFCSGDPYLTRRFAAATFLGDNRADLARVTVPSLVIQSEVDSIASPTVGRYVHAHLPKSDYLQIPAVGHCPHMTAPELVIEALRKRLAATGG